VQRRCFCVLKNAACHDDNRRAIVEANGVASILAAVRRHKDDCGVQEMAFWALSCLACNDTNKVKIMDEGALALVLNAMDRLALVRGVQEKSLCLLMVLAVNARNVDQIGAANGMQRVVSAMRNHKQLRKQGYSTLCALSRVGAAMLPPSPFAWWPTPMSPQHAAAIARAAGGGGPDGAHGIVYDNVHQRRNALVDACARGDLRVAQLLVEVGDASLQLSLSADGDTALHAAAAAGHGPVVGYLLTFPSMSLSAENAAGHTAEALARAANHVDIAEAIRVEVCFGSSLRWVSAMCAVLRFAVVADDARGCVRAGGPCSFLCASTGRCCARRG
jgi:hypothetical protein